MATGFDRLIDPRLIHIMIFAACIQSIAFAAFVVFPEGDKSLQGDSKAAYEAYKIQDYKTALKLFAAAAAKNDKVAQYALGRMYEKGTGVERSDMAKAEEFYKKSADQGHELAQYSLAIILLNDPARLPQGLSRLKESANAGSSKAQLLLGQLYANGQGTITRDEAAAIEQFTKAAEKGEADAYVMLGQMCEAGKGMKKDMVKAVEYYEKGTKRDSIPAINKLAGIYLNGAEGVQKDVAKTKETLALGVEREKDGTTTLINLAMVLESVDKKPAEAFVHYKKAAEKGNVDAMFKVGSMYAEGTGVEKKDQKQAFTWYKSAAEKGSAAAMFGLATAYEKGEGIEASAKDSKEWLIKSAVNGWPVAMRQLGVNYRDGKGFIKDMLASVTWLQKAVANSDGESAMILAEMFESGKDIPRDLRTANMLYTKVAEAGSAEAQTKLGSHFAAGLGTTQDLIRAYALLLAAGEHKPAVAKREELAKKMTPVQIEDAKKEYDRMKRTPGIAPEANPKEPSAAREAKPKELGAADPAQTKDGAKGVK